MQTITHAYLPKTPISHSPLPQPLLLDHIAACESVPRGEALVVRTVADYWEGNRQRTVQVRHIGWRGGDDSRGSIDRVGKACALFFFRTGH